MNSRNKKPGLHQERPRIRALREAIRRSFPAVPYEGKVTPHDGEWLPELTEENAILDDDKFLYEGLKGRKWTEIPRQLLNDLPDDLPLLTDGAFVAFLAAWLLQSLENLEGNNDVRNFLVYNFSPNTEMVPDMTWFKKSRIRILNSHQRLVVRSLLVEFTERESSEFVKKRAAKAVELIDSLS